MLLLERLRSPAIDERIPDSHSTSRREFICSHDNERAIIVRCKPRVARTIITTRAKDVGDAVETIQ